jgi:regulator of sigma E protease
MEFLSTLFYFVIVIGVLVVVHEFGHFIAARLSGMRADVFSVGMGQRVFGWNKINGFTFGNIKMIQKQ